MKNTIIYIFPFCANIKILVNSEKIYSGVNVLNRRMGGNTDNERSVKTRGNLKSDGCPCGHIKSWLDTWIKWSAYIPFDIEGENSGPWKPAQ